MDKCPHCGLIHDTTCHRIKAIDYHEDGVTAERIEEIRAYVDKMDELTAIDHPGCVSDESDCIRDLLAALDAKEREVERLKEEAEDRGEIIGDYNEIIAKQDDQLDALDAKIAELEARLAQANEALAKATEAIIMMSGSSDFSTEGQAGKWWAKFRDETFYPEIMPLTAALSTQAKEDTGNG